VIYGNIRIDVVFYFVLKVNEHGKDAKLCNYVRKLSGTGKL